jgi:hypothetical protein
MLAACTVLNPGFFISYWSARFGRIIQVSARASHWLENFTNFMPTLEENEQYSTKHI